MRCRGDRGSTERAGLGTTKGPPANRRALQDESATQMALTSSGMPGPNVVDTAPFWM
jgi:hypothetical protein